MGSYSEKVCALKGKDKEKKVIIRSNFKKVKKNIEEKEEVHKEISEVSRTEISGETSTYRDEALEMGTRTKDENGDTDVAWAQVSPGKSGRSQTNTPQRNDSGIQISASKFSVLSLNE